MKELLKLVSDEMLAKIIKECGVFSKGVKNCAPAGIVVGIFFGALTTIGGALNDMKNK